MDSEAEQGSAADASALSEKPCEAVQFAAAGSSSAARREAARLPLVLPEVCCRDATETPHRLVVALAILRVADAPTRARRGAHYERESEACGKRESFIKLRE